MPALPDSRRHAGVTHSDGVAQLLDAGAQLRPRCHGSALGKNRSEGSKIRVRLPACACRQPQT